MAPNVTVPMNFGIEMLDSPTHSNLTLNTSVGVVKASSVILSFNSPVISHMTGTLHMTSVDMLEFGEQAVRLFVDAAYSGTSDGLTKELFRDVNKMSHVFEVTWLSSKCNEFFKGMCTAVKTANYDELCYLFEEASYLFKHLKFTEYLEVVIGKVEQLTYKQQFLDQYLKDAERLSTFELDAVLLLAGEEVSFVIKALTRQLTLKFKTQEPSINHAEKYLLDNANLFICKQSNSLLFDQLFNFLEQLPDLKWVLALYRKSDQNIQPTFAQPSKVTDECNVIPNMYMEVNHEMDKRELFEWVAKTDKIHNSLMALEALETWYLYNKSVQSYVSIVTMAEMHIFHNAMKRCSWYKKLPNSMRFLSISAVPKDGPFAPGTFRSLNLIDLGEATSCAYIEISCLTSCLQPLSLLSQDTKLKFHFRHPSIKDCTWPGKCGFILKTVPSNGGLRKLELCVKEEDYCNESIHFHEEVRAENMHVYFSQKVQEKSYLYPLSWLKFLTSSGSNETLKKYIEKEKFYRGSLFKVLYEHDVGI